MKLGFIIRHRFWCDHHPFYIEPTPEQVKLNDRVVSSTMSKLALLTATTAILNMNNKSIR